MALRRVAPAPRAARRHRRRGACKARAAVVAPSAPAPGVAAGAAEGGAVRWRQQWYPVGFTEDLKTAKEGGAPVAFTLLGEGVALWADESGTWRAAADRCPHRLAPLTEGRVVKETGELECGYHGWTFDKTGACTSIPQLGHGTEAEKTALASKRSCVAAYPTQESQGMLWVLPTPLGSADMPHPLPDLPLVPELDDPLVVNQDVTRDLPYDYATLLENVLDVSHVPFTHHGSVGRRENATPVGLELKEGTLGPAGFEGVWEEGPRSGKYGSQYTQFVAPTLMMHTLRTEQFTTLTVVYAVPTTPGNCRLFARFPFIFKAALPRMLFPLVPRWYSHMSQNAILEDDQIFLHEQERLLEREASVESRTYAQSCYMPAPADVYVQAFRRWLTEHAGGSPAWPEGVSAALPPRMSRTELLDRFNSHTVHCSSCSAAHANLVKARKALRVVSLVALAGCAALVARSAPTAWALAAAGVAAGAALLRELFGTWVRKMRQGPYPPPRREPTLAEKALEAGYVL